MLSLFYSIVSFNNVIHIFPTSKRPLYSIILEIKVNLIYLSFIETLSVCCMHTETPIPSFFSISILHSFVGSWQNQFILFLFHLGCNYLIGFLFIRLRLVSLKFCYFAEKAFNNGIMVSYFHFLHPPKKKHLKLNNFIIIWANLCNLSLFLLHA